MSAVWRANRDDMLKALDDTDTGNFRTMMALLACTQEAKIPVDLAIQSDISSKLTNLVAAGAATDVAELIKPSTSSEAD